VAVDGTNAVRFALTDANDPWPRRVFEPAATHQGLD